MWVWGWLARVQLSISLANRVESALGPCQALGHIVPSQQLPVVLPSVTPPGPGSSSIFSGVSAWLTRAQNYRIPTSVGPQDAAARSSDGMGPTASAPAAPAFTGKGQAVGFGINGGMPETRWQGLQAAPPAAAHSPFFKKSAQPRGESLGDDSSSGAQAVDAAVQRAASAAAAESRLQGGRNDMQGTDAP